MGAFTWALMIVTGVGGTDYYPSRRSTPETCVVCALALGGAILWTQILADFCDVASNGDPEGVSDLSGLSGLSGSRWLHLK